MPLTDAGPCEPLAGTVLFLSIIISLVVREQNIHFYKCSRWQRGQHRESFLSGHKATGCHCEDAVEWTARRHWPGLEEWSCLSYCPISHVPSTVLRCCCWLLSVLPWIQHRLSTRWSGVGSYRFTRENTATAGESNEQSVLSQFSQYKSVLEEKTFQSSCRLT